MRLGPLSAFTLRLRYRPAVAEPADEVTWREAAGILGVGLRPVGKLVARPVKVHDRRWVTSWLEATGETPQVGGRTHQSQVAPVSATGTH
jgi:hypothetical protein